MGAALYNGYPLVYSDTGTYLHSGFTLEVPRDRPIFYGLFMRLTSLGFSLWLVALAQCLLLSSMLARFISLQVKAVDQRGMFLLGTVFLALTSSLSWYTGQLMADIFAPVVILSAYFFFIKSDRISRRERLIWLLVGGLAMMMHLSHVAIGFSLGLVGLLYWGIKGRKMPDWQYLGKRLGLWMATWLVALLMVPSTHALMGDEFRFSKASHVFFMGRMLDSGILDRYLDEYCEEKQWELCQYKDQLPEGCMDFIWNQEKSPVYQMGGWEATEQEFSQIINHTLRHPKYLGLHFWEGGVATFRQLLQNPVGEGLISDWYASETCPVYLHMQKFFPYEFSAYLNSRQCVGIFKEKLDFTWLNILSNLVLSVGLLITLGFIGWKKFRLLSPSLQFAWLVLPLGILINAAVTGALANVYGRLESRVIWLFPLLVLMLAYQWYQQRKEAV
ncbi:MAG: hypothetical protein AAFR61_10200 [Bacteroidota bacterium]